MYAVRNIRLCTKDCLCLFVCPTGASDTENGQIDKEKCIDGCRLCVDACPSGAISLVPDKYQSYQIKSESVVCSLLTLAKSKIKQEKMASYLSKNAKTCDERNISKAVELSNRILAEDLFREAGYMIGQNEDVIRILEELLKENMDVVFPHESVKKLINLLNE